MTPCYDVAGARVCPVHMELLEALAAENKEEVKATPAAAAAQNGAAGNGYTSRLDVPRWLNARGIEHRIKPTQEGKGRTVYLITCPFDAGHTGGDCCIMQEPGGKLSAHCFHNSCRGRGWKEFKERIGKPDPDHYDPPLPIRKKSQGGRRRAGAREAFVRRNGAAGGHGWDGPAGAGAPASGSPENESPPGDNGQPATPSDQIVVQESLTDPHRLGRLWLERRATVQMLPMTIGDRAAYYREQSWQWLGTHWAVIPDAEMKACLNWFLKWQIDLDFADMLRERAESGKGNDENMPTVPHVTPHMVSCVLAAIAGDVLVPGSTPQPSWRGTDPGPRNWIALRNWVLDVDALLAGAEDPLRPHNPLWFSPTCLPYDFDPDADCPRWQAFLGRNLGDDRDKASLLQEWTGYLLLHNTSLQRFLMMVGEGANGKSVACAALTALLGEDNVSTVPLEFFGDKFRLAGTLGKLANIVAEVGELDKIAEGQLKAFVTGDALEFERKFKQPFTAHPTARLMLSTNNAPQFSDKSDGVWRRMLLLPFTVQIPEEERIAGMDKVVYWQESGELPGILNWALAGLHRLRRQGRFTVPKSCQEAAEKLRVESNPARRFLQEHYQAGSGEVVKADLYEEYGGWCRANGHHPLAEVGFGREVFRVFKQAKTDKAAADANGYRAPVYTGLVRRQEG